MTRIIICMAAEASRRLLSTGHYLQSDIAFRRIVGFLEFELACMERDAKHHLIFVASTSTGRLLQRINVSLKEIEAIVKEDTGKAKGLGLHLQKLASNSHARQIFISRSAIFKDLNPYDQPSAEFIASAPSIIFCNIKKFEYAWRMMLGMGTLCYKDPGKKAGKAGNESLASSSSSLESAGERSFIPIDIWSAGDANSNLVESVHRDVNREGVHCTLLGGLKKGQLFDTIKMKTLSTYESYGITPSYKTGHISENAFHNLKRKSNTQHRVLTGEDQKIERYNERLVKSLDAMVKAEKAVSAKEQELLEESRPEKRQKLEATNGEKFIEKGIGQGQIAHRNGHGLKIKRENVRHELQSRRDSERFPTLPIVLGI
ncbi:hypothetical protein B0H14DRAFT_2648403 [Mycena olivaceomarginata]|nr:hypothetical protein B0H14DRAFT_2648403 [Mycena olivaceomarginata]